MAGKIGRVQLGRQGLEVSAQGLGCMSLAGAYSPHDAASDAKAENLITHAFNKGVTFFDTSDLYGLGSNEIMVGKAIKSLPREQLQIATKFGILVTDDGGMDIRGDPKYVRECCEASLKRLDVDYIDLYYQHRIDPLVPIEVTMGEMKKLVEEGKVKYIGLSEAAPDTIRRAHAVHPISAVQLEYSLWERSIEDEIFPLCRELGIGVVPYGPLGRGFFTGKASKEALDANDTRSAHYPKFSAENVEKNRVLFERVSALAEKHGCSPGKLALAWVCNQADDRLAVVPIPGTTKTANLDENLDALKLKLEPSELEAVAAAVPKEDVSGGAIVDNLKKMSITWKDAVTPPLESWTAQAAH